MNTDVLRLAEERDASAIAAIYAPSVTSSVTSFELVAPDPDEMATRIAKVLTHAPWIVLVRDHDVVGYAYASRHRDPGAYLWSVNTSVYVRADQKRTGTGRALYRVLLNLLRIQGFYSAYAGIALPNDASVGLHEAMGFEPIGVYRGVGFKAGEWREVGWWQLALRPREGTPESPLPLQAAQERADWSAALLNASEP